MEMRYDHLDEVQDDYSSASIQEYQPDDASFNSTDEGLYDDSDSDLSSTSSHSDDISSSSDNSGNDDDDPDSHDQKVATLILEGIQERQCS